MIRPFCWNWHQTTNYLMMNKTHFVSGACQNHTETAAVLFICVHQQRVNFSENPTNINILRRIILTGQSSKYVLINSHHWQISSRWWFVAVFTLLGLYIACVDGVFYMLISAEAPLTDTRKWTALLTHLVKTLFRSTPIQTLYSDIISSLHNCFLFFWIIGPFAAS